MIEIRNIHHTALQLCPLKKLVEKYARSLKLRRDVVVVFDRRLTGVTGGLHRLNYKKDRHVIQIYPECEGQTDEGALKYGLVTYILHELKHAQQEEVHGYSYHNSNAFSRVTEIHDKEQSEHYSRCETEARMYECKHIHNAVDFYNAEMIS